MSLIPAPPCNFKASLVYIASSRPARPTLERNPVSNHKTTKQNKTPNNKRTPNKTRPDDLKMERIDTGKLLGRWTSGRFRKRGGDGSISQEVL